jgi:hypothetical protein
MSDKDQGFDSYCILELMGHVRMAGRVTEEERFGSKIGRIDVPKTDRCEDCNGSGNGEPVPGDPNDCLRCARCKGTGQAEGFTTVYFGGSSVYRLTPTTEEVARAVAKDNQPRPVSLYELPRPREVAVAASRYDRPSDDRDDDQEF